MGGETSRRRCFGIVGLSNPPTGWMGAYHWSPADKNNPLTIFSRCQLLGRKVGMHSCVLPRVCKEVGHECQDFIQHFSFFAPKRWDRTAFRVSPDCIIKFIILNSKYECEDDHWKIESILSVMWRTHSKTDAEPPFWDRMWIFWKVQADQKAWWMPFRVLDECIH